MTGAGAHFNRVAPRRFLADAEWFMVRLEIDGDDLAELTKDQVAQREHLAE
jgi:hypothetical protein